MSNNELLINAIDYILNIIKENSTDDININSNYIKSLKGSFVLGEYNDLIKYLIEQGYIENISKDGNKEILSISDLGNRFINIETEIFTEIMYVNFFNNTTNISIYDDSFMDIILKKEYVLKIINRSVIKNSFNLKEYSELLYYLEVNGYIIGEKNNFGDSIYKLSLLGENYLKTKKNILNDEDKKFEDFLTLNLDSSFKIIK